MTKSNGIKVIEGEGSPGMGNGLQSVDRGSIGRTGRMEIIVENLIGL